MILRAVGRLPGRPREPARLGRVQPGEDPGAPAPGQVVSRLSPGAPALDGAELGDVAEVGAEQPAVVRVAVEHEPPRGELPPALDRPTGGASVGGIGRAEPVRRLPADVPDEVAAPGEPFAVATQVDPR